MRIILLSQWFDPEPGATKGLPLAKWLQTAGHEVRVLTGFPNYPGGRVYDGYRIRLRQREVMDGVDVLRVPLYPSHSGSGLKRALNYTSFALSAATIGTACIGPADVAYVYHPPPTIGLAASSLELFRRVPFVYHIADMWPDTVLESGMLRTGLARSTAPRLISAWCRAVYSRAAAITVLSPGFRDMLIERGVAPDKIHVIYNWTDEDAFGADGHPAVARELGFDGRFNVVYAGNFGPLQDLETVIRAAALLENHPAIRIVLVGTGSEEARLKTLVAQSGAGNVTFVGRRQYWEMAGINAAADVLLVHLKDRPFLRATIPGKTQVTLASGRPILLAVAGDAADLVRSAEAGIVCPPENPRAMADAILELYRMPRSAREAMGRRASEFYRRRISIEVGGRETLALLEDVAARRPIG